MSLLVVGSVAYDSVQTPAGRREMALGGSAVYFSLAASYFTDVSLVAVVGSDFAQSYVDLMLEHDVDLSGLERVPGETFQWSGVYSTEDVNQRETLDTRLNVFAEFEPVLSQEHRGADYLFLANIDPDLQLRVLRQMDRRPSVVALDSMNFWIDGRRSDLDAIVAEVDMLFLDEGEARSYSGEANLVRAARRIQEAGPRVAVIKRGEHGALVFDGPDAFAAPAMPLDTVVDPTGAGDSFAGGFIGALAATGDTSNAGIRRAAVVGCAMGSFTVADFSADRLATLTGRDIQRRFEALARLTAFERFPYELGLPLKTIRSNVGASSVGAQVLRPSTSSEPAPDLIRGRTGWGRSDGAQAARPRPLLHGDSASPNRGQDS